ncbi:hypothetical protein H4582DRAFT_2045576 [Lactarius indigo]|nr:hypothetical protein H4582DRAFT_2045576 [Lactarius indigo]
MSSFFHILQYLFVTTLTRLFVSRLFVAALLPLSVSLLSSPSTRTPLSACSTCFVCPTLSACTESNMKPLNFLHRS